VRRTPWGPSTFSCRAPRRRRSSQRCRRSAPRRRACSPSRPYASRLGVPAWVSRPTTAPSRTRSVGSGPPCTWTRAATEARKRWPASRIPRTSVEFDRSRAQQHVRLPDGATAPDRRGGRPRFWTRATVFLASVAALVQVHGGPDPTDLVRDGAWSVPRPRRGRRASTRRASKASIARRRGADRLQRCEDRRRRGARHEKVDAPGRPPHEPPSGKTRLHDYRARAGLRRATRRRGRAATETTAHSADTSAGSTRLRNRIFCR